MLKNKYKFKALRLETGKINHVTFSGFNEEEAFADAVNAGFSEIIALGQVPAEPPTEAQLQYAKKLGAIIQAGLNKQDVSAIIDMHLEADSAADFSLREFSEQKGIEFSNFIGNQRLHDIVFESLNEQDKTKFFTLCVLNDLEDKRANLNLNTHARANLIDKVSEKMMNDKKVVESVCRYKGRELISFGNNRGYSNGTSIKQGSKGTIGYRSVYTSILHFEPTLATKPFDTSGQKKLKKPAENSGCLLLVATMISIILTIAIGFIQ